MAKELPYFKFFPGEWIMGDITMCSYSSQGLFINICSLYWSRGGDLDLSKAKKRFANNSDDIDELIESNVMAVDDSDKIIISFLDEQITELSELSLVRSRAGSKGGKKDSRWSDLERKKGDQVYVLLMNNDDEAFIKIGITQHSISNRYSVPIKYNITTIYQWFTKESANIEEAISDLLSTHEYEPKIKFPGYTEAFNIDSIDRIDEYFKDKGCKPVSNHKQTINKLMQLREEKIKIRKDKDNIPAYEEFRDYAKVNKPKVDLSALELKYKSWLENGWYDGNGKKIVNWKTKLLNTIPHLGGGTEKKNLYSGYKDSSFD